MNLRAVAPKASLPVVGNVPAAGFHMFMKFKGIPKIPKNSQRQIACEAYSQ
jgi:hypothetical protein